MAQSTLTLGATDEKGKGKGIAKTLWADDAAIAELATSEKNERLAYNIHPVIASQVRRALRGMPDTMQTVEGRPAIKRSAYNHYLQLAVANAVGYAVSNETPLVLPSARGGGYSKTKIFTTMASEIFSAVREVAEMAGMGDEQTKSIAFARVHAALQSHEMLSGAEVSDEVLEALWTNAEVELELDDDDDDTPAIS